MNESDLTNEFTNSLAFTSWLQVIKTYQTCHNTLTTQLKDLDLSVAQHDVLANINHAGSISQQDLADKLLVVKSNITALLGRLEKRKLIQRETDPNDARSKRVSLTKEGQKLVAESLKRQNTVVAQMAKALSDNDMQQLTQMMQNLRSKLKEL